ncbi:MAG: PCRF domain-containing protein, partial [Elusimicrobiota bacterium]|nr:PCRF domain-containing protein [Elusimicrobiota bacterium]
MIKQQLERIQTLEKSLNIASKLEEISVLEKEVSKADFWADQNNAKKVMSKIGKLKSLHKSWDDLNKKISELNDLEQLAKDENDEAMLKEIEANACDIEHALLNFETQTKLDGEFDSNNAILSIHSGAGGTEACDWAQMLTRLYCRWAEKKGFEVETVDSLNGEEAGIKSITMIVKGNFAYGLLQSEIGVHRLVRVSPFDSNSRRHTSFASVDVIPEVSNDIDIVIDDKDIRIDTYRASGAGG